MKIRYFLLVGIIVTIGTSFVFNFDMDDAVGDVIFSYIVLGIFPMVWIGYQAEKAGYSLADSVQTLGLDRLFKPLAIIFMTYFMLAIGSAWFGSFSMSLFFPEFTEEFLSEELFPANQPISAFLLILYIGIVGPIVEEFIFRGLLLNRIAYKLNVEYGIIISSFLFAIFHFDIIGSFITGVVFSLLYIWTKNLLYPILLHIANNCLAMLLMLLPLPSFLNFTKVEEIRSAAVAIPGIIIILISAPLLYLTMKKYKDDFKREEIYY